MCHENESWTRSLPIILLGLRTTWRADFQSTPAELLYGENIRSPCDFFEDTKFQPQSEFVQKLKATMKQVKLFHFHITASRNPLFSKAFKVVHMNRLKPCFSDNPSETDSAINHKSNPVDKPTSPVKKKRSGLNRCPLLPQPDSQEREVKLICHSVISEIHLGRVFHLEGE
ncbi:uncharacterized protein NPIL_104371 [Nephila pilipes]|uniref:Uncharacterized protein n=1 Tax=Nephila pilipes TaxID=299642 RepID=A0A8X6THK1_NEPPI|nr:uncharacterized protein NPIL_104371 [Nephila pilipes]